MVSEEEIRKLDFKRIVLSGIVTAGSLIIGLVWKDYMDGLIKQLPLGSGVEYPIGVTAVITVFLYVALKVGDHIEKDYKEKLERLKKGLKQD